jgi:C1A family cysteine protease
MSTLSVNYKEIKMTTKQPIVNELNDPGVPSRGITNPVIPAPSKPSLPKLKPLPKYHWVRDPSYPNGAEPFVPELTESTSVATVVDMRPYCSPIDDQGDLGSCTGNSLAGGIDLLDIKYNGKQTRVSRLFIYYYERVLEGDVNYDNGAYIHDGIKVLYTYGAPVETLWPYVISQFKTKPSAAAIADGAKRKLVTYQSAANFAAVKSALASGYPVIIGFDVYSSFEGAWGNIPHGQPGCGMMPYPNTKTEQLLGGHAVCIVGYNDANSTFIVRNSWGTSWGDNGYFYMPYEVIQNTGMSSDFWVVKSVQDPS